MRAVPRDASPDCIVAGIGSRKSLVKSPLTEKEGKNQTKGEKNIQMANLEISLVGKKYKDNYQARERG